MASQAARREAAAVVVVKRNPSSFDPKPLKPPPLSASPRGTALFVLAADEVAELVRDAADDDYRFASLVLGVVQSMPFQQRVVLGDTTGETP
jgi:hypothetical protein